MDLYSISVGNLNPASEFPLTLLARVALHVSFVLKCQCYNIILSISCVRGILCNIQSHINIHAFIITTTDFSGKHSFTVTADWHDYGKQQLMQ
jgi:hypothetical protein